MESPKVQKVSHWLSKLVFNSFQGGYLFFVRSFREHHWGQKIRAPLFTGVVIFWLPSIFLKLLYVTKPRKFDGLQVECYRKKQVWDMVSHEHMFIEENTPKTPTRKKHEKTDPWNPHFLVFLEGIPGPSKGNR